MLEVVWEPFWTILLFTVGSVYFIALGWVRSGLSRLPELEKRRENRSWQPSVSVIIPCRDEANHIGAALDDLAKQDYPRDLLQIIVVDDRSADGTGEIASSRRGAVPGLTVLRVSSCPENTSPKKNAILRGLNAAKGEIIITTDGDCRFKPGWISSLVGSFTPDTGAVTGLTIFDRGRPEPFWQRLQQLDYMSHSFFAAGAIGGGLAFNCNGSNLALRRETFEEVGGYNQFREVITGDDTLLLQRIRRSGKWRLHFSADPQSTVHSWPEESPMQVFNQRLRWGSGGASYSPTALGLALLTFAFFLGLFLSPIFWISGLVSVTWFAFFALKIIFEGRVMHKGWTIFGLKPDWAAFLALELVHIPAILTFSIGGHLWGFRWKGQRFKRTKKAAFEYSQATNS